MRRSLALLALLVPLAAAAEEEVPVDAASPPADDISEDAGASTAASSTAGITTTTTTTSPDGTTTTTTTSPALGSTAPGSIAPGSIAPDTRPSLVVEEDPCGTHRYARWRHRVKGRISIGFSKSHLELEDEIEGTQKSFVARVNGRRGWSIELELSKLTLDGGDSARTAGASVVKTFGRRKLAPYLLAGGGGGRYETVDGVEQRMGFGEVGAGVMLRGKRFSIGLDLRRGMRKLREDGELDVMRSAMPGGETEDHAHDHYSRGRVLALLNF
jgi:hypothetical protein